MKQLKLTCRDIGVDCDVVFLGATPEEIMQKAAEHALNEHNLPMIPPNIYKKCLAAIKEVEA
jgi:predicted small metal-binding protein